MKKIISISILSILLTLTNNCSGYKPIFASKNMNFKISEHITEGDKRIGNEIYSKLYRASSSKTNNKNIQDLNIYIKSEKEKMATAKDTTGKTLEYKMSLNINIKITKNTDKDVVLDKIYNSSLRYKIQEQYSDTIKLENKSVKDIIDQIYQNILIDLSKNI